MILKCVAIDDEPLALVVMEHLIKKHTDLHLVTTFDDAISGAEFLRQHPIDILFIDINMPDITGIELVTSMEVKPMIIFTTAHKKFATESYELNAIDYLVKPITQERFDKAMLKAFEYASYKKNYKNDEETFFVRAEYRLLKVNISDIEYIESKEDYCKIHFKDNKSLMTLMTLKSILEKLPAAKFKRIHRRYIVSVSNIQSIVNRKVQLPSAELPVSISYLPSLSAWIKK